MIDLLVNLQLTESSPAKMIDSIQIAIRETMLKFNTISALTECYINSKRLSESSMQQQLGVPLKLQEDNLKILLNLFDEKQFLNYLAEVPNKINRQNNARSLLKNIPKVTSIRGKAYYNYQDNILSQLNDLQEADDEKNISSNQIDTNTINNHQTNSMAQNQPQSDDYDSESESEEYLTSQDMIYLELYPEEDRDIPANTCCEQEDRDIPANTCCEQEDRDIPTNTCCEQEDRDIAVDFKPLDTPPLTARPKSIPNFTQEQLFGVTQECINLTQDVEISCQQNKSKQQLRKKHHNLYQSNKTDIQNLTREEMTREEKKKPVIKKMEIVKKTRPTKHHKLIQKLHEQQKKPQKRKTNSQQASTKKAARIENMSREEKVRLAKIKLRKLKINKPVEYAFWMKKLKFEQL